MCQNNITLNNVGYKRYYCYYSIFLHVFQPFGHRITAGYQIIQLCWLSAAVPLNARGIEGGLGLL